MLDYFADQVDYQIQTQLVSELMARYVEVSRQLEVRNRQLEQSDANRREAQIIAALGNWQMNLATNRLWWSDTMKELLDLPDSEDAEIERFLETVHPEDLPLIQTVLEELYRGAELRLVSCAGDEGRANQMGAYPLRGTPDRKKPVGTGPFRIYRRKTN